MRTGGRSGDDDEGARPDDFNEFLSGPIVIPDDARELDADRMAWLEEETARLRRERRESRRDRRSRLGGFTGRFLLNGRGDGPGPLVYVALGCMTLISMVALLIGPKVGLFERTPLGSPSAALGKPGGLLPPDVVRFADGDLRSARGLRPAVFAVADPECRCADLLKDANDRVHFLSLPLWLVGAQGGRERMNALAREATRPGAEPPAVLEDIRRALVDIYTPTRHPGVSFVTVGYDGIIGDVILDAEDTIALRAALQSLPILPSPGPNS